MLTIPEILELQYGHYIQDMTKHERQILLACAVYIKETTDDIG